MIDVESESTQQNNVVSPPVLNLEEDDEWMSDENIDSKIDILRKQMKNQSLSQPDKKSPALQKVKPPTPTKDLKNGSMNS